MVAKLQAHDLGASGRTPEIRVYKNTRKVQLECSLFLALAVLLGLFLRLHAHLLELGVEVGLNAGRQK